MEYFCRGTTVNNTCKVLNYDYQNLSLMNYENAIALIKDQPVPDEINCLSKKENKFYYEQDEGLSIVPKVISHKFKLFNQLILILYYF